MSVQMFSTPVPTVNNRHIQIHMYSLCMHDIQKGYRHINSHVIDCMSYMHTQFKSRITTYTLRLSVFDCQNRLITEPVEVKGGQFTADL